MKKILSSLVLTTIVGLCIFGAFPDGNEAGGYSEPPIIIEVEKTVIEYIEVPVEKPVYYPVTEYIVTKEYIYLTKEAREFKNHEELTAWLALYQDKNIHVAVPDADCDDMARLVQLKAHKDGYIVNSDIHQTEEGDWHTFITAWIGNDVYWIEPSTFEIVMRSVLD